MTMPYLRLILLGVFAIAALLALHRVAFAREPRTTALFANSRMIVRGRISVEVIGKGPDLVFIPGLSSSRATWRETAERLKSRYRLHLVQVAGFAGEPARGNASGDVVVPTAEAIDDYIVEQHLAPATVIGHSLGGTMSLYLAEHHPADIRKIMIVDAFPFLGVLYGGPNATKASIKAMTDTWRSGQGGWSQARNDEMMASMVTAPADVETISGWQKASDPSVTMRALFEDMLLDLRPGLATLAQPVTVLFPDYEPPGVPSGAMKAMHETVYEPVRRKTIREIANSRHFIMFDQPEQFASTLDAFLAD